MGKAERFLCFVLALCLTIVSIDSFDREWIAMGILFSLLAVILWVCVFVPEGDDDDL